MSAPTWLPPLNSHEDYITGTKIQEAKNIKDYITSKRKVTTEGMFYIIHVKVSVRFFTKNNMQHYLPGLHLERLFLVPCHIITDPPYDCTSFKEIMEIIVTKMNIPFQLYPICFQETDNSYSLLDEHALIHRILLALSTIRSKSDSNIVPVLWHIFKDIAVSGDEYEAWKSWYNQKSRANPNFKYEYMAAIRRPRTTEELLSEDLVKFKAASTSSIEALEVVTVENFDTASNCLVCLGDFCPGSEAIRLPCSHVFHRDCIVKWLQKSHMCPLCRFKLPASVKN